MSQESIGALRQSRADPAHAIVENQGAAATQSNVRGDRKTLLPDRHISTPAAIHQICSNKTSRSKVERRPRSDAWLSKKTCADVRPSSRSKEKNSHSALSLEEAPSSVSTSLAMRWTRMPAHCAPSLLPGSATCRSKAIMRSSFSRTALKDTSFSRLRISEAERGEFSRSTGLI